ncbi:MAG TPA: tetratricopeptide repeat protein [Candidatus Polarisedimenticolia bacterium]|nr:tetratricopeptide repeat protein [Candidatus Polarisedimenticolia bacterium]
MTTPGPTRRRRSLMALCGLACLLLALLVQGRIEAGKSGRDIHPLLYLPSGKYLKVVALGFDGLLADVLYLWSIQYYGNYAIKDRYEYLERIYEQVITELDPHYLDPYFVGALIMTTEGRDPEMALRLLDKGVRANPDKWIVPFEAGFLCYNDLHDYQRAAAYFEKALAIPDVHPLVRRLHAEMFNRAGDKRTSLGEWLEIYRTTDDPYVRNVAWNHAHDLKVDVDLADLRDAVSRFHAREGRPPRRLQEIVQAGLLPALPRDPEERDYSYDAETGQVLYRGGLVLGR